MGSGCLRQLANEPKRRAETHSEWHGLLTKGKDVCLCLFTMVSLAKREVDTAGAVLPLVRTCGLPSQMLHTYPSLRLVARLDQGVVLHGGCSAGDLCSCCAPPQRASWRRKAGGRRRAQIRQARPDSGTDGRLRLLLGCILPSCCSSAAAPFLHFAARWQRLSLATACRCLLHGSRSHPPVLAHCCCC